MLSLLRYVDPKRITITVLVVALFASGSYIKILTIQRDREMTVYKNPRRASKSKKTRSEGAVRVVVKYIERPDGTKETTREEVREPVIETTETAEFVEPVPIRLTMAAARSDRYLVAASLQNFSPRDRNNWTVWGGYSFKNRVDVMAGATLENSPTPSVLVGFRF